MSFPLLVGVVWDAPLSAGEEERDEVSEVARITRDLKNDDMVNKIFCYARMEQI